MKSQNELVLNYLESGKPLSDLQAYNWWGIRRLGARIYDLRSQGYTIFTFIQKGKNRFGRTVRYARYRMKKRST